MNDQPVRRGRRPKITQGPSELARDRFPSAGLATLSRDNNEPDELDMFFEAEYEGRTRRYEEVVEDDGTLQELGVGDLRSADGKRAPMGVVTSGQHPDRIPMWKPTPNGYSMREVPVTAIKQNLQNGWKSHCPDCGRRDHGGSPNDCPARDKVMYTVCPICPDDHKVYDNYQLSAISDFVELEKDPAFVQFDAFKNSTPQARVEAALTLHMWSRHPQETRAMGIAPLAEPSLTVLETMLATGPNSNPIIGGAS